MLTVGRDRRRFGVPFSCESHRFPSASYSISPYPAPVSSPTSSSIRRWAAKPIISRSQVRVPGLLDQTTQAHHLVGHRWSLGQVGVATRSYRHHR